MEDRELLRESLDKEFIQDMIEELKDFQEIHFHWTMSEDFYNAEDKLMDIWRRLKRKGNITDAMVDDWFKIIVPQIEKVFAIDIAISQVCMN